MRTPRIGTIGTIPEGPAMTKPSGITRESLPLTLAYATASTVMIGRQSRWSVGMTSNRREWHLFLLLHRPRPALLKSLAWDCCKTSQARKGCWKEIADQVVGTARTVGAGNTVFSKDMHDEPDTVNVNCVTPGVWRGHDWGSV